MAQVATEPRPEAGAASGTEDRAPLPSQPILGGGSGRGAKAPSGNYWPVIIVALLVGGAGANIGLMIVATRDASFAVEPNYYQKALRWDDIMAQEARNGALGWSVAVAFEGVPQTGQVKLTADVKDRAGHAVEGARVDVEAFHSARARHILTATLRPESTGRYAATLALDRPGLWELRVRVERGDQLFTRTLVQDLTGTP